VGTGWLQRASGFENTSGIDRSIGTLRKGLRELGIEQDTLLWYCSDNGGLNLDPDAVGTLRGHKGDLYEGGIRVPGIIEWPGHLKPQVTDFPASTMDIMPTIVDLLDLPEGSHDLPAIRLSTGIATSEVWFRGAKMAPTSVIP
jgi:arylsulfatase A-like enzyme